MARKECREALRLGEDEFVIFWPSDRQIRRKRFDLALAVGAIVRRKVPRARMLVGGRIDHKEMPLYYNAADVILQTSKLEVSPTVVKESLACEVPLVSTHAGDTEVICQGLPNVYLCGDEPAELAEAVLAARGTRVLGGRQRLRTRGLALEQIAGRLVRLYQQVV
jgi:glycosyltransferase involved in cell wall biosynthesis